MAQSSDKLMTNLEQETKKKIKEFEQREKEIEKQLKTETDEEEIEGLEEELEYIEGFIAHWNQTLNMINKKKK